MKKLDKIFLGLSLLFLFSFFYYFNYGNLYRCGLIKQGAPLVTMGLSPYWSNDRFQINSNLGSKEVLASKEGKNTYDASWLKGGMKFNNILAYDLNSPKNQLFFKATDWNNETQIFSLSKSNNTSEYAFIISKVDNASDNPRWISVDKFSCRIGAYKSIPILFFILFIIFNYFYFFVFRR